MTIGVLRDIDAPCYDDAINYQVAQAKEVRGEASLDKLFNSGDTWVVE